MDSQIIIDGIAVGIKLADDIKKRPKTTHDYTGFHYLKNYLKNLEPSSIPGWSQWHIFVFPLENNMIEAREIARRICAARYDASYISMRCVTLDKLRFAVRIYRSGFRYGYR